MINKILKAKHWQIFLLTFLLPMMIQYGMMGVMFTQMSATPPPDPDLIFNQLRILPIIMLIFIATLFSWYWSIGIGLQKLIPNHLQLNVNKFKFAIIFPIIYMFGFMALFISVFTTGNISGGLFAVIFPLHLIAMLCGIYMLYFIAKTYKTAEKQQVVKFGDFVGEFLMLWFYPIGIWILQPKINEMVNKKS